MKRTKVKEMAGKKIHIVPNFSIETLRLKAKSKYDILNHFWTNNKLDQDVLNKQWFNFTMMRNHFDTLDNLYKSSQESEKRLIGYIHKSQTTQTMASFDQSIKDQKALNEQFKITNENTNTLANSVLGGFHLHLFFCYFIYHFYDM